MATKVSGLGATTSLANTDLLYVVTSAATSPNSNKMTFASMRNVIAANVVYADTFAGADMGAQINAAYSALPSTGGVILVPSGSYTITTPIVFGTNAKRVSLRGYGAGTTFIIYTPTSGNCLTINTGNPTGHLVGEITGITFQGKASLVAAGQVNTNTSVGVYFGGANGCPGYNLHDCNLNGFGSNIEIGANAYMLNIQSCAVSGGNGGQASRGALIHINAASNSGERNNFINCAFTDPGNSIATNGIYITSSGTASNSFMNCSIDNTQIFIGASNGQTSIIGCHFENAAPSTYGAYIPVQGVSSDRSTLITFIGNSIANDGSGGTSFVTIIRHGGQLYAASNIIDNYAGGTVTNFILHDLDNGVATDYCVQLQVQGGALTNIIGGSGGVAYTRAAGNSAIHNVDNSYSIGMRANASNTNNFFSGGNDVASFNHTGDWTFGISSAPTNHTFYGRVLPLALALTSANDVTLGNGNAFDVSGTTTINTIAATGWTSGSTVTLRFSTSLTVKHNTAGGGAVILLAGAADFSATANDTLSLQYDGTSWREVARAVI